MGGLLNSVGGCGGTLPSRVAVVTKKCEGSAPRKLPGLPKYKKVRPSGLEPFVMRDDVPLNPLGGRCNLVGSVKSKKL
eukprot:7229478-Heterocapsa_arctica.AAC.1